MTKRQRNPLAPEHSGCCVSALKQMRRVAHGVVCNYSSVNCTFVFLRAKALKNCLQKCVVWDSRCAPPSWNLMIWCYQKRDQAIGFSSPSFPRAALPVPAPLYVRGAQRRGLGTPLLPWRTVGSDRSGGEQEGQRGTQRGVISMAWLVCSLLPLESRAIWLLQRGESYGQRGCWRGSFVSLWSANEAEGEQMLCTWVLPRQSLCRQQWVSFGFP